jgi:hypothetical protein
MSALCAIISGVVIIPKLPTFTLNPRPLLPEGEGEKAVFKSLSLRDRDLG